MKNRTAQMYMAVFRKLKELAPHLRKNLRVIMSDFGAATAAAAREEFPNAHLSGCDFHFKQVNIFTFY